MEKSDLQVIIVKPLTCGPILRGMEDNKSTHAIRVWGRGCKKRKHVCYLIAKIDDQIHKIIKVSKDNDYVGIFEFTGLDAGREYEYKMGYFFWNNSVVDSELDSHPFNWDRISSCRFNTDSDNINNNNNLKFVFGSCRYYLNIGPFELFGTGDEADKIFGAIQTHYADFVLTIGDQVYLDPMLFFMRDKSLKDMRKRYKKVFTFKNIKSLLANNPVYMACDDHDYHRNDTNWKKRHDDVDGALNGHKAYLEYQHYKGPTDIENKKLWYSFDRKDCTFFVFDTRSERDERTVDDNGKTKIKEIVSENQMYAFKNWIRDPKNKNKTKFVVSSTPVVSQDSVDSWYGFPEQQRTVIEAIIGVDYDGNPIEKVAILTGDAHCARSAIYEVQNSGGTMYKVLEILSSGFVAITGDTGNRFREGDNPVTYDKYNKFPHTIDNINKGGLKFVTRYASPCYPHTHMSIVERFIIKAKKLFSRVCDNVYTVVNVKNSMIIVEVYNQNRVLLSYEEYPFENN